MGGRVDLFRGGVGPLLEMVARDPACPESLRDHLADVGAERVRVKVGSHAHEAVLAGRFAGVINTTPLPALHETDGQMIELDGVLDFEVMT